MKKTRRRTAPEGAGEGFVLEHGKGSGPWDGVVDHERGNTCVRCFMRWYRQQLGLSLHQVAALTGIDRAYLRRLERRRIHLSLVVLWRWANGLEVNVDWVLKRARQHELMRVMAKTHGPALARGSLAAPSSNPGAGAEWAHDTQDRPAQSKESARPAAPAAERGRAGSGGCDDGFPEDLFFAHLPEQRFPAPPRSGAVLDKAFPWGMECVLGVETSFLAPVLLALVS